MMKGIRKGIYLTAAAVLLLAAACTFVFSATIAVMIEGIGSSEGNPTVYIYAFLDEEARDSAKTAIEGMKDTEEGFEAALADYLPDECYQRQTAKYEEVSGGTLFPELDISGTGTSFKIYWETNKPEFGEDADRAMVYFVAAAEGTTNEGTTKKYVGTGYFRMVSGGSNSTTIQMEVI